MSVLSVEFEQGPNSPDAHSEANERQTASPPSQRRYPSSPLPAAFAKSKNDSHPLQKKSPMELVLLGTSLNLVVEADTSMDC